MLLVPLDALKTMLQVEGSAGTRILLAKLKEHGTFALWDGATVAALSMIATHYPWYLSFNYLNAIIPSQTQPWRYVFDHSLASTAYLHKQLHALHNCINTFLARWYNLLSLCMAGKCCDQRSLDLCVQGWET